ncbi:hypothetical protein PHLGIDRAFT_72581 [Phlebiopsis gigantea 11061_1 CR5-6]|uniref:Glutaredoxin domain-containing protein n=1 Tax=Phlebiopsis gigantea (strain 11061_1 CR5-6) TaxID=745531 RepID=A0A0C3RXD9_PHLG1|nr:hypothetical protein PHLGIDRAFT_72581 [Phlebiopsis gigantea 11061_1 CR5-6]
MHGVLHFVTTYPDRTLDEADGAINAEGLGLVVINPQEPVDLRVYAPDGNDTWSEHVKELQIKHPLIIFSKSYCPFSQRAKSLLASQDLKPSPTIVELDQRTDGPILQAILARLTGRRTVPNIILQGKSIGGWDDIWDLHQDKHLKGLLHENGLLVGGI